VSERFLVTGAHGCLGAWTVAELVRQGVEVTALDAAPGRGRAELLLDEEELARVRFVRADVTERVHLDGATHVIHLAALQYPYCRDDHAAGARVNVLGTLNVFDAALAAGARLVYASSIAALAGGTLYGAWKRANEGTAAAFWAEDGFPSIGIRPALVYGVGRDRGVTASLTLAMAAAARGEPFHVVHGGSSPLNHAGDVARVFVRAARAVAEGAPVYDAGGPVHHVRDVVRAIEAAAPGARLTFEDEPFAATPPGFDGRALEAALGPVEWRPLERGVNETVTRFRELGAVAPAARR
jgi:nucleoside-diphosphate-sugar epimerase